MGKRKMSKRAPGAVAALIGGILAVILLIAFLVVRFAFPAQYGRLWAELFVHAIPIEGGGMEDAFLLPMEVPEAVTQGVWEETDPMLFAEAKEHLRTVVDQKIEEGMANKFEAVGAYLISDEGEVKFAQNEHEILYPASMTKLITALVVVDQIKDLDEIIFVPELEDCYEAGSMLMGIDPGDSMSYRDFLHAMLMCSYNDTASTLAINVGGSLEEFADLMNAKAEEIGCVDSHFVTPHGLYDEEHYSSAYDMTMIIKAAVENEFIQSILTTREYTATLYGESGTVYAKYLTNSNYFLTGAYEIPGMTYIGGKTGYIFLARSCIATSFVGEDGHTYYSAVMKALDAPYMTVCMYESVFAPYSLPAFFKLEPIMQDWQLEYEEWYYD